MISTTRSRCLTFITFESTPKCSSESRRGEMVLIKLVCKIHLP